MLQPLHYATAYANTTPTLRQHYARKKHQNTKKMLHYATAYASTTPLLRQHYATCFNLRWPPWGVGLGALRVALAGPWKNAPGRPPGG